MVRVDERTEERIEGVARALSETGAFPRHTTTSDALRALIILGLERFEAMQSERTTSHIVSGSGIVEIVRAS